MHVVGLTCERLSCQRLLVYITRRIVSDMVTSLMYCYLCWHDGSIAEIVIIKYTVRSTYWIHSVFLQANRPKLRTKIIGSMKGIYLYILRNIQYIELESKCPGVSNKGEPCVSHLEYRKDSSSLPLCSLVLCYFR